MIYGTPFIKTTDKQLKSEKKHLYSLLGRFPHQVGNLEEKNFAHIDTLTSGLIKRYLREQEEYDTKLKFHLGLESLLLFMTPEIALEFIGKIDKTNNNFEFGEKIQVELTFLGDSDPTSYTGQNFMKSDLRVLMKEAEKQFIEKYGPNFDFGVFHRTLDCTTKDIYTGKSNNIKVLTLDQVPPNALITAKMEINPYRIIL